MQHQTNDLNTILYEATIETISKQLSEMHIIH